MFMQSFTSNQSQSIVWPYFSIIHTASINIIHSLFFENITLFIISYCEQFVILTITEWNISIVMLSSEEKIFL